MKINRKIIFVSLAVILLAAIFIGKFSFEKKSKYVPNEIIALVERGMKNKETSQKFENYMSLNYWKEFLPEENGRFIISEIISKVKYKDDTLKDCTSEIISSSIKDNSGERKFFDGYSLTYYKDNIFVEEIIIKKNIKKYGSPIILLESLKFKDIANKISPKVIVTIRNESKIIRQAKCSDEEKYLQEIQPLNSETLKAKNQWIDIQVAYSQGLIETLGDEKYLVIYGQDRFRNLFARIFLIEKNKIKEKAAEIFVDGIYGSSIKINYKKVSK
ncbi:MAG: hypothetical protein ACRCSK_05025 [Fusobacteriaceae bacterium]